MGRNRRGRQDGSGPYKGSFQERTYGKGRRQQAGLPCPAKESRHGKFVDRRGNR